MEVILSKSKLADQNGLELEGYAKNDKITTKLQQNYNFELKRNGYKYVLLKLFIYRKNLPEMREVRKRSGFAPARV